MGGTRNRQLERTDTTGNTAKNQMDRMKQMMLLANAYSMFVMSVSYIINSLTGPVQ